MCISKETQHNYTLHCDCAHHCLLYCSSSGILSLCYCFRGQRGNSEYLSSYLPVFMSFALNIYKDERLVVQTSLCWSPCNVPFGKLSTDSVRNLMLILIAIAVCWRTAVADRRRWLCVSLSLFAFVLRPAGGDTTLLVSFLSHFKVQSPSAIPPKDAAAAS